MAFDYKTPGVYVEEISSFPPSIAAVETAIPAFIGYTEKAMKNGVDLISPTPTPMLIKSMAEYIEVFGGEPSYTNTTVLGSNNEVLAVVANSNFYMFNSLRLFYDNGGGKCYVVSVGKYSDGSVDLDKLKSGLAAIEKVDAPTILLSQDAVLTAGDGLYDFQKASLAQCEKLQDRVAICDLKPANQQVANETFDDRVQQFRNKIGISALRYGAAYAPWLKTTLSKTIKLRDITLKSGSVAGPTLKIQDFTTDNGILQIINDLNNSIASNDRQKSATTALLDPNVHSVEAQFKKRMDEMNAVAGPMGVAYMNALKNLYGVLVSIVKIITDENAALPTVVLVTPNPASTTNSKAFTLKNDITDLASTLKPIFESVLHHFNAMFSTNTTANKELLDPATLTPAVLGLFGIADHTTVIDATVLANYTGAASNLARVDLAKVHAGNVFSAFMGSLNSLKSKTQKFEDTFEKSLVGAYGFYKNLISRINDDLSAMPPSGAIAGIYAKVDGQRGVWKAPANESLNSVSGPDISITNDDQEGLNVDTNSGKSINAIRSFTGKGTLVWGARTLAGNDNEWRYVSVRRFFNMVEESTKKATEQFVFEPNDANTWIKVQAMIENFLNSLWRVGALQGAKPEHAYYVAVGLGKTMTPLDILEGRMIIEIGMAAVRPAEFIILRFSHKMAES